MRARYWASPSPAPALAAEVGRSRNSMDDNGGARNRIVHGYFGIDDPILFTTIERDLKPLLPRPEALARAWGGDARKTWMAGLRRP